MGTVAETPGSGMQPPTAGPPSGRGGSPLRRHFGLPGVLVGTFVVVWHVRWVLIPAAAVCLSIRLLTEFVAQGTKPLNGRHWAGVASKSIDSVDVGQLRQLVVDLQPEAIGWVVRLAGDLFINLLLTALVAAVAAQWCADRRLGLARAGSLMTRRAWSFFRAWLLAQVLPGVPLMAGVLVAVWFVHTGTTSLLLVSLGLVVVGGLLGILSIIVFFIAGSIILIEGRGPFAALRRAAWLAVKRLLPVVGTTFVTFVFMLLVEAAVNPLLHVVHPPGWVEIALQRGVSGAVTTTVTVVMYLLRYFDTRLRTESFDRALLATELR